ncbi:hypothetical protein TNCV_1605431 [Trichonephila clavipes]|nr:hypothetical protein TNCV_1605431 [Trichonephila clavipes]
MNEARILCYLRGIRHYVIGPMLLAMKPLPKRRISTIGLVARGKKVSLRMIAQPGALPSKNCSKECLQNQGNIAEKKDHFSFEETDRCFLEDFVA